MMEGFEVQQNNSSNNSLSFIHEDVQKRERLTAEEISGQLNVTTTRYEEELEKLKSGDNPDQLWLATYQDNLVCWMNDMKIMEGTLKSGNEEVLDEIEKRLYLISEELEKTIH